MGNPLSYTDAVLAAAYNRRLTSVKELWDKVRFSSTSTDSEESLIFFQIFQLRLRRWIFGTGHPLALSGLSVTPEQFREEMNNPTLRAQLFLVALTDSDLLPVDPYRSLVVGHSHQFIQYIFLISLLSGVPSTFEWLPPCKLIAGDGL